LSRLLNDPDTNKDKESEFDVIFEDDINENDEYTKDIDNQQINKDVANSVNKFDWHWQEKRKSHFKRQMNLEKISRRKTILDN